MNGFPRVVVDDERTDPDQALPVDIDRLSDLVRDVLAFNYFIIE